jgi:hypothetical protein
VSGDDSPTLGIGALVRVVNDGLGDQWDGEPLGLIVGAGSNQMVGYPGVGGSVSWTVAFEVPSFTVDGRGPFERVSVPARQLVPVEPSPDDAGAEDLQP